MALSTRVFVVETAEDQDAVFMGVLAEQQDAGVVLDWGCVVPVSLADDDEGREKISGLADGGDVTFGLDWHDETAVRHGT